jgi:hypothetical protein
MLIVYLAFIILPLAGIILHRLSWLCVFTHTLPTMTRSLT